MAKLGFFLGFVIFAPFCLSAANESTESFVYGLEGPHGRGCENQRQGPPGPEGPPGIDPAAYAFIYFRDDSNQITVPGSIETGVVEFSTNAVNFASTGSFVFLQEDITFNPDWITGIQVPVEGDYSIEFYVAGSTASQFIFDVALGGIFVPSASAFVTGTVVGFTPVTGGIFSSTSWPVIGSLIVHLTPAQVVRLLNGSANDYTVSGNRGPDLGLSNGASFKIFLLREGPAL